LQNPEKRAKCGKTLGMDWVYLSPHFDDIAFSCGGLVWEQTQRGESVSIWTVCAGEAPPGNFSPYAQAHHERWQTEMEAVAQRRLEDIRACEGIGASYFHLSIPDAIYRRAGEEYFHPQAGAAECYAEQWLYTSHERLFGELDEAEEGLIRQLSQALANRLPVGSALVSPLGLGGHVDHRLTRAAAEALGRPLWYYADFPYVLEQGEGIAGLLESGWEKEVFPISSQGLEAWYRSIAAHQSQISTFWSDLEAMRAELEGYFAEIGGISLWRRRKIDVSRLAPGGILC
jgi:LmbE family N-acetylglucosaminyl deacetylase